ncbi:hypothetical protein [Tunturiibacter gelidoferens]|uniref:RNase H-like nuclease (RuvC/YqgF family) n=1 Tax=Tunturiibacter gelidiferens TaxID=3069689 RepID=A0A9X0U8A5_9BACT|nr:hypothetical protein [Edaphobacter lichenicola]MBB5331882.1 putative RNase H-like nuclease (RuvC/YqgF family) [Edaphobacter lichenicola]
MSDTSNDGLSEEMRIELGESLASLGSGQVKLQKWFMVVDTKIRQQDQVILKLATDLRNTHATVDRLTAQIALQQKLIDSHQGEFEILKMREQQGCIVQ